jgi:UDP:flavonoid glycosyltransferase YjiC (YdhE family)
VIPAETLSRARLRSGLVKLLSSTSYHAAAEQAQARISALGGLELAVDIIEEALSRAPVTRLRQTQAAGA